MQLDKLAKSSQNLNKNGEVAAATATATTTAAPTVAVAATWSVGQVAYCPVAVSV